MPSFHINYLAVLVSALAAFVIGMLWYSALFARQWMAANAYTPEKIQAMKDRGMTGTYVMSFIGSIITAVVLAVLIDRMAIDSWMSGAKLGGLAWLGFAAPIGLSANLFSDKPRSAWVIDTGHQLVYLVVMAIILAVWH